MPGIFYVLVVHRRMRRAGRHGVLAVERFEVVFVILLHPAHAHYLEMHFLYRRAAPVLPMKAHVERNAARKAHVDGNIAELYLGRTPQRHALVPLLVRGVVSEYPGVFYLLEKRLRVGIRIEFLNNERAL